MKVKTESPPTRCDICHQSDCYNPETNHCSRCDSVIRKQNLEPKDNDLVYDTLKNNANSDAGSSLGRRYISLLLGPLFIFLSQVMRLLGFSPLRTLAIIIIVIIVIRIIVGFNNRKNQQP